MPKKKSGEAKPERQAAAASVPGQVSREVLDSLRRETVGAKGKKKPV